MTGRQDYLDAAYAALAADGPDALGLRSLCLRMGVTTGSFYHWFGSWAVFVEDLLEDWKGHRTTALRQLVDGEVDPVVRLELMAATTRNLDQRTEASIRLWSRSDRQVASTVAATDAERYAVVRDAMEAVVGPGEADRYTRWGCSVLVGFEQLADTFDIEDLRWSLARVLESAQASNAVKRQSRTDRSGSAVTSARRSTS